jgi:hypothetical protein
VLLITLNVAQKLNRLSYIQTLAEVVFSEKIIKTNVKCFVVILGEPPTLSYFVPLQNSSITVAPA